MRFSWNQKGFEELRSTGPVVGLVQSAADSVASRAGKGYVASTMAGSPGPTPKWNRRKGAGYAARYRGIVYPDSWRAKWDNARNNTLVKLTGGGW